MLCVGFTVNRFVPTKEFPMSGITFIGLAAAFCTTVSFVPQVMRTWRTRSTEDISLSMFLVFTIGIFLWLLYGLLTADLPVIAANAVTFVLSAIILGFKIRYG